MALLPPSLVRLLTGLGLWTLATTSVQATATLTCSATDRQLSIELFGNIGSGHGAAIQVVGGAIKLKAMPGKFKATEFAIEAGEIVQQWTFGDELRIGIAPKDVDGLSVYLAIMAKKTKSTDIDRYRGTYVLKVQGPKGETELKGRLKGCDAG